MKGLLATIKAIEDVNHQKSADESQEPVTPVSNPASSLGLIPSEGGAVEDDLSAAEVLSQFDDLEAEVMSVLDDADFDIDDFGSDEDVPVDYDEMDVEIGVLSVDNPTVIMEDCNGIGSTGSENTTPTRFTKLEDHNDVRMGGSGKTTPTGFVTPDNLNDVETRRSREATPTGFENTDASEDVGKGKLEIKSSARLESKKRTSKLYVETII